jgi:hypothetical protein
MDAHPAAMNPITATKAVSPRNLIEFFIQSSLTLYEPSYESPFSLLFSHSSFLCYTSPMAVTQTVDIPADRRITLEVPREVPPGRTILTFTPVADQRSDNMESIAAFESEDEMIDFINDVGKQVYAEGNLGHV